MPSTVTASCGLDVVCHAVESFTAKPFNTRDSVTPDERPPYQGSNPISDIWSAKAIESGGRFLKRAVTNSDDIEARSAMMLAATIAGIGFGNAGVHIPHACAYPIASLKHNWTPPGYPTGHAFIPHGFSVTVTAPAAFRLTQESSPKRHNEAARLLTAGESDDLADAIEQLMNDVGAPTTLTEIGYESEDIPALIDGALKQQRLLVTAPMEINAGHIENILRSSL